MAEYYESLSFRKVYTFVYLNKGITVKLLRLIRRVLSYSEGSTIKFMAVTLPIPLNVHEWWKFFNTVLTFADFM